MNAQYYPGKSLCVVGVSLLLLAGPLTLPAVSAPTLTLVDSSTQGYYNNSLGMVLDRTNPYMGSYLFPGANVSDGDPRFKDVPEPDLSASAAILGDWLGDPGNLNSNWSGLQNIPANWAVNSETAVVYEIDAGLGVPNVVVNLAVDNGVYVWLDGNYEFGAVAPGHATQWEYSIDIGNLSAGKHYLQILREDHGVYTGYDILVTGNYYIPAPAAVVLAFIGVGLATGLRRIRVL